MKKPSPTIKIHCYNCGRSKPSPLFSAVIKLNGAPLCTRCNTAIKNEAMVDEITDLASAQELALRKRPANENYEVWDGEALVYLAAPSAVLLFLKERAR